MGLTVIHQRVSRPGSTPPRRLHLPRLRVTVAAEGIELVVPLGENTD